MALGNKESINLVTLAVFLYLISLCQAKPFSRPLEGLQLRCCGAVQTPILFEDETNLVS